MFIRTILCLSLLSLVNACIAVPRFEMAQKITFDATPPSLTPMSYEDLLCCYDCQA